MNDNRLLELNKNLLSYLGSELDHQRVTYASLPTPVKGGFDTRIFGFQLEGAPSELSRPLILRLFGKSSQNRALFESAVQNAVASSGYPAPHVFFTGTDESWLGGSFMVMERMPGQPMDNLSENILPEMLAQAHLHLHSIDSDSVRVTLEVAGIHQDRYSMEGLVGWLVERIDAPRFEWLHSGSRWIVANRPEDPDRLVVCHGDFHTRNILTTDGKVSGVLDWSGCKIGDPAYDIGITKVLGTVAAPSLFPKVNWTHLTIRYYDYYQRECPVDPVRVGYYEALRCLQALFEGAEGHLVWSQPEILRKLSEHFETITSVGLALPNTSRHFSPNNNVDC
jgi:aminoglycoside phosphotransferase (APT) family kinase protein